MPQAGGPTGTRLLLRRLRDVMAGGGSAQDRLNKIVTIVAADMVAEVCSAYVMRPGEVLELFASKGLKPEAVHKTRLRVGEGIVGDIAAHARPFALAEAQSHPNFAYRPETGEEIYHSLMGVPVLRGGRVLGVLVVQNRTPRHYTDEEVEALETIATILAELVASGELVAPDELQPTEASGSCPCGWRASRSTAGSPSASPSCMSRAFCCARWWPRIRARSWSGFAARSNRCRARSTTCWRLPTSPMAASTATFSRHIACSPKIAAGSAASARSSTPASPPKPPSRRSRTIPARAWTRSSIPICANGCSISRISPTG
jgi:putative methionine-R-sulfoxide reductase with GAF domain